MCDYRSTPVEYTEYFGRPPLDIRVENRLGDGVELPKANGVGESPHDLHVLPRQYAVTFPQIARFHPSRVSTERSS